MHACVITRVMSHDTQVMGWCVCVMCVGDVTHMTSHMKRTRDSSPTYKLPRMNGSCCTKHRSSGTRRCGMAYFSTPGPAHSLPHTQARELSLSLSPPYLLSLAISSSVPFSLSACLSFSLSLSLDFSVSLSLTLLLSLLLTLSIFWSLSYFDVYDTRMYVSTQMFVCMPTYIDV